MIFLNVAPLCFATSVCDIVAVADAVADAPVADPVLVDVVADAVADAVVDVVMTEGTLLFRFVF